jgi:type IV secretory pathway VirB10-like protein
MKRLAALFCLLVSLAAAQTADFYQQLTPEERQAAGIDQLTPAQRAALDASVARFVREGARQEIETAKAKAEADAGESVRRQVAALKAQAEAEKEAAVRKAQTQAQAEQEAAVKKAQETARAENAAAAKEAARIAREQAKAEAKAEAKRRKEAEAGMAARSDDESIRTRIMGEFRGWDGATVFTLANGQVWQQTDKERRNFPKTSDPEVELVPSTWFGWKLTLVSEGLGIRVKRIK